MPSDCNSHSQEAGPNPFGVFRKQVLLAGTELVDLSLAMEFAVAAVKSMDPVLELGSLLGWIVSPSEKYAEAVQMAAEKLSVKTSGPTIRAEAVGVAIALKGKEADILVLQDGIVLSLFAEAQFWPIAWNTLHHELGHVHDHAQERGIVYSQPTSPKGIASRLLAIALWSEYHASRRALCTFGDAKRYVPLLLSALDAYNDGAREMTDLDRVFSSAGYVLGNLDRGQPLTSVSELAASKVLSCPLGRIWPVLATTLERMYGQFAPRTSSFYDDLDQAIVPIWNTPSSTSMQ